MPSVLQAASSCVGVSRAATLHCLKRSHTFCCSIDSQIIGVVAIDANQLIVFTKLLSHTTESNCIKLLRWATNCSTDGVILRPLDKQPLLQQQQCAAP